MKAALFLVFLFALGYTIMVRLRARTRIRMSSPDALASFSMEARQFILDAGDDAHSDTGKPPLGLRDLWKLRTNHYRLLREASALREMPENWESVSQKINIEELHSGLLSVTCAITYKLCLSAFEIVRGHYRPTQYLYTRSLAHAYCVEVDIVETMAETLHHPAAALLERHLA